MIKTLNQRKPRSIIFNLIIVASFAWLLHEYLIIEYVYAWFFSINTITFITFGKDKMASKVPFFTRTPEVSFHMLGVLGGFPAILTGRQIFNHKTSKSSFIVPMWILFFAQLLVAAWFFGNLNEVYTRWENKTDQQPQEKPFTPEKPAKPETE